MIDPHGPTRIQQTGIPSSAEERSSASWAYVSSTAMFFGALYRSAWEKKPSDFVWFHTMQSFFMRGTAMLAVGLAYVGASWLIPPAAPLVAVAALLAAALVYLGAGIPYFLAAGRGDRGPELPILTPLAFRASSWLARRTPGLGALGYGLALVLFCGTGLAARLVQDRSEQRIRALHEACREADRSGSVGATLDACERAVDADPDGSAAEFSRARRDAARQASAGEVQAQDAHRVPGPARAPAVPPEQPVDPLRPPANPADLPADMGIVIVNSTEPLDLYVGGVRLGNTGERLVTKCGEKRLRLGKSLGVGPNGPRVEWRGPGEPRALPCRKETTVQAGDLVGAPPRSAIGAPPAPRVTGAATPAATPPAWKPAARDPGF